MVDAPNGGSGGLGIDAWRRKDSRGRRHHQTLHCAARIHVAGRFAPLGCFDLGLGETSGRFDATERQDEVRRPRGAGSLAGGRRRTEKNPGRVGPSSGAAARERTGGGEMKN